VSLHCAQTLQPWGCQPTPVEGHGLAGKSSGPRGRSRVSAWSGAAV